MGLCLKSKTYSLSGRNLVCIRDLILISNVALIIKCIFKSLVKLHKLVEI